VKATIIIGYKQFISNSSDLHFMSITLTSVILTTAPRYNWETYQLPPKMFAPPSPATWNRETSLKAMSMTKTTGLLSDFVHFSYTSVIYHLPGAPCVTHTTITAAYQ
jgi:hypothetical protein